MPGFELNKDCRAPVEEVWKLLFDPDRFPDWWAWIEAVRKDAPGQFTLRLAGHPDFPLPQTLRTDQAGGRVIISCQVFAIDMVWQLAEAGAGTAIPPERHRARVPGTPARPPAPAHRGVTAPPHRARRGRVVTGPGGTHSARRARNTPGTRIHRQPPRGRPRCRPDPAGPQRRPFHPGMGRRPAARPRRRGDLRGPQGRRTQTPCHRLGQPDPAELEVVRLVSEACGTTASPGGCSSPRHRQGEPVKGEPARGPGRFAAPALPLLPHHLDTRRLTPAAAG
jgi:hypothetical protein